MSFGKSLLKAFGIIGLILVLGVSMNSCGFGGDSWKEEVLLHDGSRLIVKRSQSYGGRHEIGQSSSINEWSITFELPSSKNSIAREERFDSEVGSASLGLLAVEVVKGTPYIVTDAWGCVSYNKWGRPNPPYVIFKYEGKAWQRISLEELPVEIKEANVINNTNHHRHALASHSGIVTANEIKELNGTYSRDVLYQKVFVRTPLPPGSIGVSCPDSSRYTNPKAPN